MDINEVKRKLLALDAGPGKRTTWKPKDEHTVRCLDVPGDNEFGREVGWHYGVADGGKMYCPATDGDECPFCELAESLRAWKDTDGNDKPEATRKQDFEWFKQIQRSVKHYVPIAVRRDDGELDGPFWWEMSPRTYGELLKICVNDDWNDGHPEGGGSKVLTSTTHGLDVVVSMKRAGQKGNKTTYDLTDVEERKKFTPLSKTGNSKSVLERIPAFDTAAKSVTTDEARVIFGKFQAGLGTKQKPGERAKMNDAGTEYSGGSKVTNHNTEKLDGNAGVEEIMAKLKKQVDKTNA